MNNGPTHVITTNIIMHPSVNCAPHNIIEINNFVLAFCDLNFLDYKIIRRDVITPSTATPPIMVPKDAISNFHGVFNTHDGNKHVA